MYISQVEIDTKNRQKIRELTHLGAYHNWVEQSFPEEFEESKRTRKLWRIDQLHGKHYLLIVSPTEPDVNYLESYGVVGSARIKSYDNFLSTVQSGIAARFKVTLNPVFSEFQGRHQRGRVVPYLSDEDQMMFLLNRSEKNGFTLRADEFTITEKKFEVLKKTSHKDIRLSRVTYEGSLTVGDANLFKQTLSEGFGKKKAYGFGLMTIIPESRL